MTIEECKIETQAHIDKVRHYIRFFTDKLTDRAEKHDASKMGDIEAPIFAEHTENLSNIEFGSEEYKKELEALKPALDHHYKYNRHHPQYFGEEGINGMNLIDIVEMLADWRASVERVQNGDIFKSIEINAERFGIDEQFKKILINTARMMEEHQW